MGRIAVTIVSFLTLVFLLPPLVFAQSGNNTSSEEKEGKVILEKLQTKQVTCDKLSDENFERLGEYFMGQMVGNSHEAMNTMMQQMMGKNGEEQMHIVMGKRLSGCTTSAQIPQNGLGFMPMMWIAQGGGNPMMGFGNVMGWNGGWAFFGFLFWLFWIVILVDLVLLGILLWKKIKKEK